MRGPGNEKLLTVLPEPCLLVRADGTILDGNASAAELLGISREDLPEAHLPSLLLDDAIQVRRYLREAAGAGFLSPGRVHIPSANGSVPCRAEAACLEPSEGGGEPVLFLRITPRQEENDRFLLLNRQIRELGDEVRRRIRLEAERERLIESERAVRAELENANRLKDEFLAVVSHELRTPLNNILIWASLIRSGMLEEETFRQGLAAVERSGQVLGELIQDLLDVSRAVSGKLHLRPEAMDLLKAVEDGVNAIRPTAELKDVRIGMELSPAAAPFRGDPDRIRRLVWHLVSNAVKFTPTGGDVSVRLSREDDRARLVVADSGIGIAPEALPFVFNRFQQIEPSRTRSRRGLGLGLATVRHVVELHGGSVSADSEGRGRGATFTVTLPLKRRRSRSSPDS